MLHMSFDESFQKISGKVTLDPVDHLPFIQFHGCISLISTYLAIGKNPSV